MIHPHRRSLAVLLLFGLLPSCDQSTTPSSNTDASPSPPAPSAAAPTGSGARIPEITAGTWFNVPAGKTTIEQKDLDGKIVFVEFWATW